MTTLLVVLTVVEVLILVGALSFYLIVISRSLERIAQYLAKVTYGVRAIETQCESIGPSVVKLNQQLSGIEGVLEGLAMKAERIAG
ncbi:MAG: hypothetical protein ACYC06_08355 [Ilumatobacteraceae bacterium]